MSSHTRNSVGGGELGGEIESVKDLLLSDYETIELAMVKLTQEDPREIRSGRIVALGPDGGLRIRRNGFTYAVPDPENWTLERYKPVTTTFERNAIEAEWGEQ